MKLQVGVIGPNDKTSNSKVEKIAFELGKSLVDHGYRIICGGMGGIMRAVAEGAHASDRYREGDVVGILPSLAKEEANEFIDIKIATGMNYARNQIIVASSDVVIALGGGAGTLSEIAFAWQLGKKIIAFDVGSGWSSILAGDKIDNRRKDRIERVTSVKMAILKLQRLQYNGKSPLQLDDEVEGYKVIHPIANHFNRYVYLVEKDGNKYVLKLHDYMSELDKNQFEKEIQLLLKLDHPHIQKVVSHGYFTSDIPYFISEYYGKDLTSVIDKLSSSQKRKILKQIEDAIYYLKDKGYVHKDLKPENILISEDFKNATLIDFYWCEPYPSDKIERMFKTETLYNLHKLKHFLYTGKRVYKIYN